MGVANISGNILTDSGTNLSSLVSGSGTTNYLPKFTGASTIGNSLIFDNGTNVGIGNTNTSYTLDVSGTGRFTSSLTASDFSFTGTGAVLKASASVGTAAQYGYFSNTGGIFYFGKDDSTASQFGLDAYTTVLWNSGNYPIVIATNNAERFRVTGAGSVGIGTSSPSAKLEVRGSGNTIINSRGNLFVASGGTATQVAGNGGQISFGAWLNGDLSSPYPMAAIKGISESSTQDENKGALIFATMNETTNAERMRITSAGNVGIGTSSPNARLSLGNTTSSAKLLLYDGGFTGSGGNGYFAGFAIDSPSANDTTLLAHYQGALVFGRYTNANDTSAITERMRITSGGDVQVQGTSSNAKIILFRNYSNSQPGISVYNTSNTEILYFNGNTGDLGITGQGYKPGGGSWANSSDIRLKENVKTIENALDKVMQLRGVTFDWKQGYTENGKKESGGFIADEVMEVFPDWVSETNATEAQKEIVNDEKIKSLSLPFSFDALLVQAIKEQQIQIQNLQEQINILAK